MKYGILCELMVELSTSSKLVTSSASNHRIIIKMILSSFLDFLPDSQPSLMVYLAANFI